MKEQVYGYIRVSTLTQAETGFGLKTQEDAIRKYCKKNNLELVEIFRDEGISGAKTTSDEDGIDRPGMLSLLSSLQKVKKIVVVNTSRLWRADTVKVIIQKEMKKQKADVISVEQANYSIYNTDPDGFLINTFREALDQYERMSINLKLLRGRLTKTKSGNKPCGIAPIGYKWDNTKIVLDEKTAPIVELIFKKYAEVKTLGKVKKYMDENDYKTNTGKDFSKQGIKNILTNEFYKGTVKYCGIVKEGQHPIIINRIVFGRVQSLLKKDA